MARRAGRIANGRPAPTPAGEQQAAGNASRGDEMQQLARTGMMSPARWSTSCPSRWPTTSPAGAASATPINRGLRADMTGLGWDMAPGKTGQTLRVNQSQTSSPTPCPDGCSPTTPLAPGTSTSTRGTSSARGTTGPAHDFEITHPPEQQINLDATYEGKHDRTLRWEFVQSDRIAIQPPRPHPLRHVLRLHRGLLRPHPRDARRRRVGRHGQGLAQRAGDLAKIGASRAGTSTRGSAACCSRRASTPCWSGWKTARPPPRSASCSARRSWWTRRRKNRSKARR